MSKVALVKIAPNGQEAELKKALQRAFSLLGDINDTIKHDATVLIKPNFGTTFYEKSVNPLAFKATTEFFSEENFNVIVGEDPAVLFKEEAVYKKWEIEKIAEEKNATSVRLRSGDHKLYPVPDHLFFQEIEVSTIIDTVDAVVSLTKLKSVNVCYASLSLKNMKGLLAPAWKRKFHCEGLEKGIVDLNKIIRPGVAIIDATYGYDEVTKEHIPVGLIIVSYDPVAADVVGAMILGLDPSNIDHISMAAAAGLGEIDIHKIQVLGEELEKHCGAYNFSPPINPFDIAAQSNGKIEIIQGAACSACLNELGNDLAGIEGDIQGKLKILVGPEAQIPETDADDQIILYGNCLRAKEKEGLFIKGCPPGFLPAGAGAIKEAIKNKHL